jgi:membrane-associated phospholipid phosphatase
VTTRLGVPPVALAAFLQSVLVFALLGQAYAAGSPTVTVDAWVANALHAHVFPLATAALVGVTTLGSTAALTLVVAIAAAYLFLLRRGREAALLVVVLAGAQLLTWILKAIFERPRPSFTDPVATASWFSFPSGHALGSIAVYGTLAYVVGRRLDSARARAGVVAGAALLVVLIGFSRLYLGVHYLTDVLAGYSAGLALLLLAVGVLHARSRTA